MKNILFKEICFAAVSIVAAGILSLISANASVMLLGFIIAVITYIKLSIDEYEIESTLVKIGWAMITYSIFVLCMLFPFGNVCRIIAAGTIIMLVYTFSSVLTQKMKLDYFGYDCGRNGIKFWTAFFLSLLSLVSLVENDTKKEEKMEAEYAKTEFVGIKSVTKEIYRGNTYYVVVTESGEIFGVDARKYPEIRTANEQNKVKYVIDDYKVNGLQKPFKLELK